MLSRIRHSKGEKMMLRLMFWLLETVPWYVGMAVILDWLIKAGGY